MGWMKNMGLKKSFFLLSALSMAAALLLIGIIFIICVRITSNYPKGGVVITFDGVVKELDSPTDRQELVMDIVGWVEIFSCILIPVGCVGIASFLFYHSKLEKSIKILQMGTERIREHDLDFSIPDVSRDELGQVCAAFETMRAQLLQTSQELWRQAEERKRLNAAFSHDLRNPVTVLKGTVKLLRQGTADEHALERMETYVLRLERYVEVMSGVQRLEQVPVQKKEMQLSTLRNEMEETVKLIALNVKAKVCVEVAVSELRDDGSFFGKGDEAGIVLDHGLFLTVAENLIGNAARYADSRLNICLSLCNNRELFKLTVTDDGCGYSPKLLQEGPKPFGRMEEDAAHFGMGLYTSRMLCMKHGGELILENETGGGAKATAVFDIRITQ